MTACELAIQPSQSTKAAGHVDWKRRKSSFDHVRKVSMINGGECKFTSPGVAAACMAWYMAS
jgi:hypothetical protein